MRRTRNSRTFGAGRGIAAVSMLVFMAACGKPSTPPQPSVPVTLADVRRADVPLLIQATGTVEPIRTAAVQSQVNAQLLHVRFTEGDNVREGQILFELDARPFEAALGQAQAALARDRAQWENAQHDVTRYSALASKEYITQQQLDQAKATAGALTGTLRGDSGAIDQARLNLQYATIRAPISGRAGSLLVKEGNQVRSGAAQTLVVINQISPILVRFPVPTSYFDAVRRKANQSLEVRANPIGDSVHVETGSLVFLDNAVDSLTGTVTLKATFPNRTGSLWPGALESVSLQLDVEKDVLVVPAAAVQTGQSGAAVWIIDSAKKAHVVKVTVRRSTDSLAVIGGGITAGQRVVIDGQLRLTDGVTVSLRGQGAPPDSGGKRGRGKAP